MNPKELESIDEQINLYFITLEKINHYNKEIMAKNIDRLTDYFCTKKNITDVNKVTYTYKYVSLIYLKEMAYFADNKLRKDAWLLDKPTIESFYNTYFKREK